MCCVASMLCVGVCMCSEYEIPSQLLKLLEMICICFMFQMCVAIDISQENTIASLTNHF